MARFLLIPMLLALLPAAAQETTTAANPIDAYFTAHWNTVSATPAAVSDEHSFLRRITLDLYGRLPTPDEIRAYIADKAPDRRSKIVDRMLASEESAEFLADYWLDILIDHNVTQQDFGRADLGPFRNWLRARFFENTPYDDIVRALIADRGPRREKPAVNFSLKHLGADPLPVKLAVMTARLFSGRDIRCAQCHDHPFEEMTQQEFWGYTEFFRPLRNAGDLVEMGPGRPRAPRDDFGELQNVPPKFLDGRDPPPGKRLGDALAELTLTAADRPSSRVLIDRMWRHFFGRPIRAGIRFAGHEKLLGALVADFDRTGTSLRGLMRTILKSRAYQLSSAGKDADRENYAVGPIKVMGAIQYFKVFSDIFNLHDLHKQMYEKMENSPIAGPQFKDPEVMKLLFYAWSQDLLLPKGRDPGESPGIGTVRMAMKMMNNKRVQGMINVHWHTSMLAKVVSKKSRVPDRIDELFLSLVGRPASESEKRELGKFVADGANLLDDKKPYEDIFWMLMNSSEFLFNH